MQKTPFLTIGTRGSALALWQAEDVRARLSDVHDVAPEDIAIEVISTSGDRIQDRPLSEAGGKGLFTKEIEEALLSGTIDLAVHSAKDMPTVLPDGLVLSAFLPREDVRDAFLSPVADSLAELPQGAVIGSSSLRRQALCRRARPDVDVVMYRGNVGTRLDKLAAGQVHATLLAHAGLKRLGLGEHITALLDPADFPPALGQGCVCIETRENDDRTNGLIGAIDDVTSRVELAAERAFLGELDGSCRTPIAGLARAANGEVAFHGLVLSPDGAESFDVQVSGGADDAARLGTEAGRDIAARAGEDFLAALRAAG